jgi:hypothetical protein
LCEEVHLNLAYRWFCRLGLDGDVPDHSTFSKNRHGRFRESDLLRRLFEMLLRRCLDEGLVGGESFGFGAPLRASPGPLRRASVEAFRARSPEVPWLGGSHYELPALLRWFTANIGIHHVHHLCSRIPYYRLPRVLRDHPELRDVGQITLLQSFQCVRLVLWDEAQRRLVSFREIRDRDFQEAALARRRSWQAIRSSDISVGAAKCAVER